MSARSRHRLNLVQAAAKLFRKQGYARTGLNDILAESRAPKGSLYHYFPGGKEQLGEEALRFSATLAADTLTALRQEHRTAPAVLLAFAERLAGWMEASAFQDGCPLATTILETVPRSAAMTTAAREGFSAWRAVFEEALLDDGAPHEDARRLAGLTISVLEGALIQARVELSTQPIMESAQDVAHLMAMRSA